MDREGWEEARKKITVKLKAFSIQHVPPETEWIKLNTPYFMSKPWGQGGWSSDHPSYVSWMKFYDDRCTNHPDEYRCHIEKVKPWNYPVPRLEQLKIITYKPDYKECRQLTSTSSYPHINSAIPMKTDSQTGVAFLNIDLCFPLDHSDKKFILTFPFVLYYQYS